METLRYSRCPECGDERSGVEFIGTKCADHDRVIEEVTFVRLDEVVAMVEDAAGELRERADANFDSPVLGRLVEKCDFAADKIYDLASQLKGTP